MPSTTSYHTHQFQQKPMSKPANFTFDLAGGHPPPQILEASIKAIKEASEKMTQHLSLTEVLDYGPNNGPSHAVEQLSLFLTRRYRTPISADSVFTMAGASQALSFLPHILGPSRGKKIFVEQPTYMHAIDTFERDDQYEIMPLETDDHGVVPESFEKALQANISQQDMAESAETNRYAALTYLQTSFANPGGWSIPRQRMVELGKIAARFNVLIMADDVYSFTNFVELTDSNFELCPYLPSSATCEGELSDNIVTFGSVSKLIAPSLRFGWVVGSPRVIGAIDYSGFIQSGGSCNHYVGNIVGQLISDGTADVLTDRIRQVLKSRFEIAESIFKTHLPGNVKFTSPKGGYFVWLQVPKSTVEGSNENSSALVQLLNKKYAVKVVDGSRMLLPEVSKSSKYWPIRVSLNVASQEDLPLALRTLADGINDYLGFNPNV